MAMTGDLFLFEKTCQRVLDGFMASTMGVLNEVDMDWALMLARNSEEKTELYQELCSVAAKKLTQNLSRRPNVKRNLEQNMQRFEAKIAGSEEQPAPSHGVAVEKKMAPLVSIKELDRNGLYCSEEWFSSRFCNKEEFLGPKDSAMGLVRGKAEMAGIERQVRYHDKLGLVKTTRWFGACSYAKLLETLSRARHSNFHAFEVLDHTKPCKIYFDIDTGKMEVVPTGLLEKVKAKIEAGFPGCRMHISGSPSRNSYHVVLSNYNILHEEMGVLRRFTKANAEIGFDDSVYTRDRVFRIIGQSKITAGTEPEFVKMDLSGSPIEKHLVQYGFDNDVTVLIDTEKDLSKPKTTRTEKKNEHSRFKTEEVESFTVDPFWNYTEASQVERLMKIDASKVRNGVSVEILRYCKINLGLGWGVFWEWCKAGGNDTARENKYKTSWAGAKYGISGDLFRRVIEATGYSQKTLVDRVKDTIMEPTSRCMGQYYSPTEICELKKKHIFLTGPCGSGKSSSVAKILAGEGKRVLWLTPRRTLADDTLTRLREFGLSGVESYLDTKDKTQLVNSQTAIVSPNSLHAVFSKTDPRYDYAVVDEIMTCLEDLISVDLHKTASGTCVRDRNWELLCAAISSAKKVFYLDAYTTTAALNLVPNGEAWASLGTTPGEDTLTLRCHSDEGKFIDDVEADYVLKRKSYVFCSKAGLTRREIETQCTEGVETSSISAEGLKYRLSKSGAEENRHFKCYAACNSRLKEYYADTLNVNQAWRDEELSVIIASSKISVGVSHDEKGVFQRVRAQWHPLLPAATWFQSIKRVRYPVSNEVDVCMTGLKIGKTHVKIPVSNNPGLNRVIQDMSLIGMANEYHPRLMFKLYADWSGYMVVNGEETGQSEATKVVPDQPFKVGFYDAQCFDIRNTKDPAGFAQIIIDDTRQTNTVANTFNQKQSKRWLAFVAACGDMSLPRMVEIWDKNLDAAAVKIRSKEFQGGLAQKIIRIFEGCDGNPVEFQKMCLADVSMEDLAGFHRGYSSRYRSTGVSANECAKIVNLEMGIDWFEKGARVKREGKMFQEYSLTNDARCASLPRKLGL